MRCDISCCVGELDEEDRKTNTRDASEIVKLLDAPNMSVAPAVKDKPMTRIDFRPKVSES